MTAHLTVVRTGPLDLLQDVGRTGHAADGVGRSGAADRGSYALANSLVGNPAGAAVIECTLGGLTVRAEEDLFVAVTGAPAAAEVDGDLVAHASRILLGRGQTLRLRTPRTGLRSYLAVGGGIAVPTVLGSASSDTLSELGPAPLANGDTLPIGAHDPTAVSVAPATTTDATVIGEAVTALRVLLGPRDDWFTNAADLAVGEWQVSVHSNRVGLRLHRPASAAAAGSSVADTGPPAPPLQRNSTRELPSEGLPLGAIQVPPSGQPVLFLADHPLTGGYPVIAVVLDDDIDRAAQLRPGQRLRFVLTS